jgi:hypothetical protein
VVWCPFSNAGISPGKWNSLVCGLYYTELFTAAAYSVTNVIHHFDGPRSEYVIDDEFSGQQAAYSCDVTCDSSINLCPVFC